MEQAQGNRGKFNLSSCMNVVRRDPLNKFVNTGFLLNGSKQQEEENREMELSLGLSMNGRFGVDPTTKRLRRSSSISNLVFTVGSAADNRSTHQSRGVPFERYSPLTRACSLPTEMVEELRRRKELQAMRRMEARKKRMEKLKNVRVVKEKEKCLESGNSDELSEVVNGSVNVQRVGNENPNAFENGNGMPVPSPQGSIGSLGSGSSGISETQNQRIDGMKRNSEVKGPPSIQFVPVQLVQKPGVKTAYNGANRAQELMNNATFDMPYVSTKWDGVKVDGFLYRYKKGEEVRIVCVCHGLFLTPAEFVKHGGGGDVRNPLKHIVVNPSPL